MFFLEGDCFIFPWTACCLPAVEKPSSAADPAALPPPGKPQLHFPKSLLLT